MITRVAQLHGGFSDASGFGATTPALATRFRVITPERRGQRHTPDIPGPITYDNMAADTVAVVTTFMPVRRA